MKDSQTKVALNWVREEIESTLEQAQVAINTYAEDESDDSQIRFASNCMHQIRGTLQILEFDGAALLAEEMEMLATAIGENTVQSKADAYEVFLSSVLRFKSYLARYGEDKPDLPIILMPIINDMRACRKQELIGAGSLINIDVANITAKPAPQSLDLVSDINLEVKKYRTEYEQGLLGFVKGDESQQNLTVMAASLNKMWSLGERVPYSSLWWVSFAFVDYLSKNESDIHVSFKTICSKIDQRFKDITKQENQPEKADALLSNLLFYVAQFDDSHEEVKSVKHHYKLESVIEALGDYEQESESLQGPDTDSIKVVLNVIKDDLDDIKESLDLYVRTNSQEREPLEALLPNMQKISDTMSILSLARSKRLINEQMTAVNELLDAPLDERNKGLVNVVESVLKLEDYINSVMQMDSNQLSQEADEDGQGDSLQVINARYQLIQESRGNLQKVKDCVTDYLEEDHRIARLENVPGLLNEVEGSLQFSKLDTLKDVVHKTRTFISQYLIEKQIVLSEDDVVNLADSISCVDYYLEGLLSSGLHGLPMILKRSIDSIDELHAHYGALEEEIEVPTLDDSLVLPEMEMVDAIESGEPEEELIDDDLIDDEVREIFIEEAEEVLGELNEMMPRWKANQADEEALSTIRRNFHTLKGSGRMVEAHEIGELGWAVENMLNRLIDNSIEFSPAIVVTIEEVMQLLPSMVNDFASGKKSAFPQELSDRADRIRKGEIITDLVVESEEDKVVSKEEQEQQEQEQQEKELLEIFRQEAEGHITNLEMFANQRVQGITQSHISDNLLRSLHTLKGVAHVSNIESLKNVIVPVESYFQELKSREWLAESSDMNLVGHTKDLLKHIIEHPEDTAVIEEHEKQILTELAQLETRFDEAEDVEDEQGRDPAVLSDLFNMASDVLNDFKAIRLSELPEEQRRDKVSHLMAATDRLNAILLEADIPEISTVTSSLGDALQRNMASENLDVSIDDVLKDTSDVLEGQFDSLAANLSIDESPDLIKQIDNWKPVVTSPVTLELVDDVIDTAAEQAAAEQAAAEQAAAEQAAAEQAAAEQAAAEQAAAEKTPVATESVDDDIDEEILEIFTEEAEEIFSSDQELLERWAATPSDLKVVAELQRNLHTLKGSARMANITEIGDLSHELEELYTALADKLFEPSAEAVKLAQHAEDKLQAMFAARQSGSVLPQETDLINQIIDYVQQAKSSPGSVSVSDEPAEPLWDQELAEIFMAEANELLANYDEAIVAWSKDLHNVEVLKPAARSLHTLKGGARLSTLSSIANLTEKTETIVELLTRDSRVGQTRWKDLLVKTHDQLSKMIMDVRQGVLPDEPNMLMTQLENDEKTIKNQLAQLARRQQVSTDEQVDVNVISLIERKERRDTEEKDTAARDVIRIPSNTLDNIVNLSGETSILRSRIEQQVADLSFNLAEVSSTVDRLKQQLRNLEIETEAQVLYRQEISGIDFDDFDPLEMDRYTRQQELTRSLLEAASDLTSLQESLQTKIGDTEASLLQQARVNTELQDRLMRTRMVPFSSIESRLSRMVRQISTELNKKVELNLTSEGEMDRTVIERMVAPLDHMLRNAIDHGIEPASVRKAAGKPEVGQINLSLLRRGNEVFIQLKDDGAGISKQKVKAKAVAQGMISESYNPSDRELYRLILQAGFSTADKVTQVSGRGVGMDVVNSEILQLGGSLNVQSEEGNGTTMTVRLPFTLASNQSLMVKVKGENYAVPLSNISTVVRVKAEEIREIYQTEGKKLKYLGQEYDLRYLGQILDRNSQIMAPVEEMVPVLIVEGEEQPIAIQVDELMGSREVVVKSVGRQLSTVPGISGASILGDGSVVLILDMQTMVDRFHEWDNFDSSQLEEVVTVEDEIPTVMVVDDSITVRKVTSRLLQRHQYKVHTAKDGVDAINQLNDIIPDVMLLDIEMPRMDGFELATLIRRDSRLKHIPIIMITSRTGEKHRQRAEEIGVNDYLGKPYNEDKLLSAIEDMLVETGKIF